MFSMSIHSGINGNFTCPSFPSQDARFISFKASALLKLKSPSLGRPSFRDLKTRPFKITQGLIVPAAATEVSDENSASATPQDSDISQATEKVEVAVKQVAKPRLVLKFIWMEKNIGLGLDQLIPGHGTIPLSPYYFWPRKDAWEELKATLESKPWISQKKMIILLNQATDIINLWQQSGGNLS